jgi:hypothetical protein
MLNNRPRPSKRGTVKPKSRDAVLQLHIYDPQIDYILAEQRLDKAVLSNAIRFSELPAVNVVLFK